MSPLLRLLTLLVLLALSGCAQVMGPQSIRYSPAELSEMLARRFPLDRRMLEVLDVRVSQPKLSLVPERNHLATDLTVETVDRLFATRLKGRLVLESGLRYEPSDQTLRLTDVRVTTFELGEPGVAPRLPLQRLGAALAELALDDVVIHRLTPEQLERAARWGYRPAAAQVTPRGVEITLVPRN